ncbi:MAG: hypothetical protein Q9162_004386 [Coniocarpon cinnabarinum]
MDTNFYDLDDGPVAVPRKEPARAGDRFSGEVTIGGKTYNVSFKHSGSRLRQFEERLSFHSDRNENESQKVLKLRREVVAGLTALASDPKVDEFFKYYSESRDRHISRGPAGDITVFCDLSMQPDFEHRASGVVKDLEILKGVPKVKEEENKGMKAEPGSETGREGTKTM